MKEDGIPPTPCMVVEHQSIPNKAHVSCRLKKLISTQKTLFYQISKHEGRELKIRTVAENFEVKHGLECLICLPNGN